MLHIRPETERISNMTIDGEWVHETETKFYATPLQIFVYKFFKCYNICIRR